MSEAVGRQTIREMRGAILRFAGSVIGEAPDTVTLNGLRYVVLGPGKRFDATTENQFALALAYLVDPKVQLIDVVRTPRDALDEDPIITYRLTAAGMRVLNGEATDVGIEL